MEKIISFDMDGTIVDFYGVENWLSKIRAHDASPYRDARALLNLSRLARRLNAIQRKGWKIRIVSWGSKDRDENFLEEVRRAKMEWLSRHLKSVRFDEICIVHYGTPKSEIGTLRGGFLFDDEKPNREEWTRAGMVAYDATVIFDFLHAIGDA